MEIVPSLSNLSIEEPIIPGLLSLNMNITYVLDIHQIEDQIKALSIRKDIEHPCVHDVLDNMIAILNMKLPTERFAAKEGLQSILKRNPNNLNALADLEHMYRGLHRLADAENCSEAIFKILNGPDKTHKATCLMEHGYALIHDMDANIEHLANNKLTDAHKMLQAEHKNSDSERKDILQKCVFHNKVAISHLDKSMKYKRTDPYSIRKHDSIQKFQQALASCDQIPLKNVWEYYIAEAWNRYVDSIPKLPGKVKGIIKATCNSLELFFRVVNNKDTMEKKNTYVSRSLVQIGHILTKRANLLCRIEHDFSFLHDEHFKTFRDDPMIPLEKAYSMQSQLDTFILNRYGRALLNRSTKLKNEEEKQTCLETADQILTKSINHEKMNWFAYSTRMQASEQLCDIFIQVDSEKALEYLKKSCEDGHQCFISKGSSIDMECLARVCQKIAKFPFWGKYGPYHVKKSNYLHDALDYLQHGLSVSGLHDRKLSYRMASCLYDLGEFTSAAEWVKRTLALTEKPQIFDYKLVCLYQLKRFWLERQQNKKPYYLIKEFVYFLQECRKKFNDINVVSEYVVRNAFFVVLDLLTDIVDVPKLLTQDGVDIISVVLAVVVDLNRSKSRVNQLASLQEKMQHISPLSEDEINLEDNFQYPAAPIPGPTDESLVPTGFEYNFFVSYSQKDVEWVKNVLLFELESKYTDKDTTFKGCFHERDFSPGKSIIQNITDAINKSYKIIVVLTKHFIKSRWCKDEMEKALIRHIGVRNCVIPLVLEPLEENEYPECLSNITYLDVTMQDDEFTLRQKFEKLKKELLPGDQSL